MDWLDDPVTVSCCGKAMSRAALMQWMESQQAYNGPQCPCCQSSLSRFDVNGAPRNTTLANVVESAQQLPNQSQLRPTAVHHHQWTAEFRPIRKGLNVGRLRLSLADSDFKMRKTLFVFMVDNSGSMGGSPSSQVRAALFHIHGISQLNKNVHVALIEYQSAAQLLPFTLSSIAKFTGGGGTYFRSSFVVLSELLRGYICSDQLEDQDKDNNIGSVSIAFLTDGQDGGNQSTLVSDFRTVLEDSWLSKGHDLTVHTIGFGTDCNKTLLEGMRTAGSIEGTFRYAEPTDGDDALCQKITDIYEIGSKGTSKPVQITEINRDGQEGCVHQARINTNEFGNGYTDIWLNKSSSSPVAVKIDTEMDPGKLVPIATNNSEMLISRTLKEWCSVLIDNLANTLLSFQQQTESPKLVALFCGLIKQRIQELHEYSDEHEKDRLTFISEQLKAIQSGTTLDIGRLNDMRFSSMFVSHGDKAKGNRKCKDTSGVCYALQNATVAAIEPIQYKEHDLKHYSRLNKGKQRNQLQEMICNQRHDTVQDPSLTPDFSEFSEKALMHTDKDGNTALMLASYCGHSKMVHSILLAEPYTSGRLSVNLENPDKESALTMAIKKRGFEATIRELASGGALLPKDRKKSLERYAIEHHWTRAASFVSTMTETGQIGDDNVHSYEMDNTMTAEYMRYLYGQAKHSDQFDKYKEGYLPLFLAKGPTTMLDLVEELLIANVCPTIEHLTEYCYPKDAKATTEQCNEFLRMAQLLIKYNPELLHQKNDNGESALYMSVKRGSKPHLLWFLEQGCDIESMNNKGATPLWSACYRQRRSFIEILLDRGANIAHQNENGNIPIYGPCERGPRAIAELLISRGSPIEHYNNNGDTLVLIACRNGQSDVLECLLEYASEEYVKHTAQIDDLNAVMASAEAGYGDCIKVLHRYGMNLNAKTPTENVKILGGATALHIAAFYGKSEAIGALLECGADPNACDINGSTPLHIAVIQGYVSAIMLLRNVSDITIKDDAGNTAMAYCRDRADIREQLVDPALDIILEWARGGFNMDEADRATCMLKGHQGIFGRERFLNIRDHNGKTPLIEATLYGDYSLVHTLLEMGASANISDIYGMYPLTWAKHNRNQRLIKLVNDYTTAETQVKVDEQLQRLWRHTIGPNANILFLGKPVGNYVPCSDSGLVSRMADVPLVPQPTSVREGSFAQDLPALRSSDNAVVSYFKDDRFQELKDSRFLWNAKAFTVAVCANNERLIPRYVLSIAMYTNNPIVSKVINGALISSQQGWSETDNTIKNFTSTLIQGMRSLPIYDGEAFIGLEQVDRSQYLVGKEFTWDRFVSATTMWRVAMEGAPSYTTKSRKGVIFAIRSKTGRLVNMCSQFGFDSELIFMPFSKFRVYDWYHGDPVALGQPNIRKHSYHVEDESVSFMTTNQMISSDKAIIIAVEEC